MIVTITNKMLDEASAQAIRRKEYKRSYSPEGNKTPSREYLKDEIDGMLGELAFGKVINQRPDFSLKHKKGDNLDFVHSFRNIDVKSTANFYAKRLILFLDDFDRHPEVDTYVAVKIIGNKAHLLGWAKKHDFKIRHVPNCGNRYVLYYDELRPMESLI